MTIRVKGEAESGIDHAGGGNYSLGVRQRSPSDCLTLPQFLLCQTNVVEQESRRLQVSVEAVDVTPGRFPASQQGSGQVSASFQPNTVRVGRLIELRRR